LVGREIQDYNFIKDRRERKLLLNGRGFKSKLLVNIIPYFGCRGVEYEEYFIDEGIIRNAFCFVFKYLANRYSKSYMPSKSKYFEHIYQEHLQKKKEHESKYYPNVQFPSLPSLPETEEKIGGGWREGDDGGGGGRYKYNVQPINPDINNK